jgi:hypothetical protein
MRPIPITVLSLLLLSGFVVAQAGRSSFVNGRDHDGEEIACDLPAAEQIKNIGSSADRKGMCVMTSIEMAARWQGLDQMRGLRDWCARQPGGAYPAKVDRQVKAFCAAKGVAVPPYVQYEGRQPSSVLELCGCTGRMACVTYGYSPRYAGLIAHMTCCAKYDGRWAVCLDCNFPGEQSYEWMGRDEMLRRIVSPSGAGWIFAWLAPPAPRN